MSERPDTYSTLAQRIARLEAAVAEIKRLIAKRQQDHSAKAEWSKPAKRHPLDHGPKTRTIS